MATTHWRNISGLVYRTGIYFVADRMALREGTNVRNLCRYQVLNMEQDVLAMFYCPEKAKAFADSLAFDEIMAEHVAFDAIMAVHAVQLPYVPTPAVGCSLVLNS